MIIPFSEEIRNRSRKAVLLGAEWLAANQVRHSWPYWTADAGRFRSVVHIHTPKPQPLNSICWNTARGAQALLSAYKLERNESILETARLALEYVKTCQIFCPELSRHHGACREETPQSPHIASRDTVEAVQAFTNMYTVTGEQVYLKRAAAGADWLAGRFMDRHYPNGYIHPFEDDRGEVNNDFSRLMLSAAAIVFAQLDSLTSGIKYTENIPLIMDWVVENSIEEDGAIKIHDGTDAGHHAVASGPLAGCFTNDDGAGVGLISSYRATGNDKYKKAAELNGTWWCSLEQMPETYASIPAALLFMLDMYRFTRDEKYVTAACPYIEKVLELQYINEDNTLAHGGFRGHESACEKSKKLHPDDPLEYICQRTTMYAMIALAKAAADTEDEWNIAYSGFGWNGEDI